MILSIFGSHKLTLLSHSDIAIIFARCYWLLTVLYVFCFLFGGGEDILAKKQATEGRLFFIVK